MRIILYYHSVTIHIGVSRNIVKTRNIFSCTLNAEMIQDVLSICKQIGYSGIPVGFSRVSQPPEQSTQKPSFPLNFSSIVRIFNCLSYIYFRELWNVLNIKINAYSFYLFILKNVY